MRYPGDVDAGPAPGGQERPPGRPGLPWPRAGDNEQPGGEGPAGSRADGGYASAGNPGGGYQAGPYADVGYSDAGYGDMLEPGAGPTDGAARWADAPSAGALYGAAGGTAGKGPVRGFPPAPGQAAPVYPAGQFSAWNQASGETRQGRPGRIAGNDAWPLAASAEHGYAEPDYSVLAVSDPAADATATQTWAVVDDRTAGGWRDPHPRDVAPRGEDVRSRASRRPRGPSARQPAAAAQAAATASPPVAEQASGRGGTRTPRRGAAGRERRWAPPAAQAHPRGVPEQAGDLPGRPARGSSRGKRARKPGRAKRGRVLLAAGLAVIVAAGSGTYFYLASGHRSPGRASAAPEATPTAAPTAQPTPSSSTTGRWGHIQTRKTDPQPLTLAELFPSRFTSAGIAYSRTAAKSGKHCSSAVLGSQLQSAVGAAGCTQVMRASYLSGTRKLMGTIGVLNLRTARLARHAGRATGRSEFIAQLRGAKGPTRHLNKGTGIEEAQVKGHYLILIWAEFARLHAPKTKAQRKRLVHFCARLLGSTANVSLSRRMVTGKP